MGCGEEVPKSQVDLGHLHSLYGKKIIPLSYLACNHLQVHFSDLWVQLFPFGGIQISGLR